MRYIFVVDYTNLNYEEHNSFTIPKGTIVDLQLVIKYKNRNSVAIIYSPLLKGGKVSIPSTDLIVCAREYKE